MHDWVSWFQAKLFLAIGICMSLHKMSQLQARKQIGLAEPSPAIGVEQLTGIRQN